MKNQSGKNFFERPQNQEKLGYTCKLQIREMAGQFYFRL